MKHLIEMFFEIWRRYYWIAFILSVLLVAGCAGVAAGARDGAAAALQGQAPPVVYQPPAITVNVPPPVESPPPFSPGTWDYIGYAVASLAAYAAGSLVKGGVRTVTEKKGGQA